LSPCTATREKGGVGAVTAACHGVATSVCWREGGTLYNVVSESREGSNQQVPRAERRAHADDVCLGCARAQGAAVVARRIAVTQVAVRWGKACAPAAYGERGAPQRAAVFQVRVLRVYGC